MSRSSLATGRRNSRDEFYTKYDDVKFELDHYISEFKDKIIYCPCDAEDSAFVKYFLELEAKGLIKEVIYTSYRDGKGTDCLSDCAIDGYRHSDIIVTNPPFSLFREFIELIDSTHKKFIIWGNNNSLTYRIMAKLLKNNRIRLGYICNKTCEFEVPREYNDYQKVYSRDGKYFCKVPACSVFTNFNVERPLLQLSAESHYCKFDNYDAINVDRVADIPDNYNGLIGVPITYLSKHNSEQFEIVGVFNNFVPSDQDNGLLSGDRVQLLNGAFTCGPVIDKKAKYVRLIIRRK